MMEMTAAHCQPKMVDCMKNYKLYNDTLHHAFLSVRSDQKKYDMLHLKSIVDNIINDSTTKYLLDIDCKLRNKLRDVLLLLN